MGFIQAQTQVSSYTSNYQQILFILIAPVHKSFKFRKLSQQLVFMTKYLFPQIKPFLSLKLRQFIYCILIRFSPTYSLQLLPYVTYTFLSFSRSMQPTGSNNKQKLEITDSQNNGRYKSSIKKGMENPLKNRATLKIKWTLSEANFPRFAEPIPNITVTIGRDALLACVVDNLKGYKVGTMKWFRQIHMELNNQWNSMWNWLNLLPSCYF